MEYKIDISNNYMEFIQLPYELHDVKGFISIDEIDNNNINEIIKKGLFKINLKNYIYNMWSQDWYDQILSINRNSIINKFLKTEKSDNLLEILVRNSYIFFENVRFISFCFSDRENRRFHSDGSFRCGDKYFYIHGFISSIRDTLVEIEVIFSGGVYVCFSENNIIPYYYNGDNIFGNDKLMNIHEKANLYLTDIDLNKLDMNNKVSPFYDVQLKNNFFDLNQSAIKNFNTFNKI